MIRLTNNSTIDEADIVKVERDESGTYRIHLRGGTVRSVRDITLTYEGRQLLERLYHS